MLYLSYQISNYLLNWILINYGLNLFRFVIYGILKVQNKNHQSLHLVIFTQISCSFELFFTLHCTQNSVASNYVITMILFLLEIFETFICLHMLRFYQLKGDYSSDYIFRGGIRLVCQATNLVVPDYYRLTIFTACVSTAGDDLIRTNDLSVVTSRSSGTMMNCCVI